MRSKRSALSPAQLTFYRHFADRYGVPLAASRIGIAAATFANMLAELPVQPGTLAQATIASFAIAQQLEASGEAELLALALAAVRDVELTLPQAMAHAPKVRA